MKTLTPKLITALALVTAAAALHSSLLQVTPAYHAAALQLMLANANLYADRLALPTLRPIEPAHLAELYITPPQFGFGGALRTANYAFTFSKGYLHTINKTDFFPGSNYRPLYESLARRPSLISSNGAFQLATQWLAAVCLDVEALERSAPHHVSQWFYYTHPYRLGATPPPSAPRRFLPLFDVEWTPTNSGPVKVSILGHTKELLALELGTFAFSNAKPLAVTNLAELYPALAAATNEPPAHTQPGTRPLPKLSPFNLPEAERRPWLESFLAGGGSLQPLQSPTRVQAYLLRSYDDPKYGRQLSEYRVAGRPVEVKPAVAKTLCDVLLDPASYRWEDIATFFPTYRVRVKYTSGTNTVDVLITDDRRGVQLFINGKPNGDLNCSHARRQLVDLTRTLFPSARFDQDD